MIFAFTRTATTEVDSMLTNSSVNDMGSTTSTCGTHSIILYYPLSLEKVINKKFNDENFLIYSILDHSQSNSKQCTQMGVVLKKVGMA